MTAYPVYFLLRLDEEEPAVEPNFGVQIAGHLVCQLSAEEGAAAAEPVPGEAGEALGAQTAGEVIAADGFEGMDFAADQGQRVEGNLTVRGGADLDVGFSVADIFGNLILDAGRVSGIKAFAFVAAGTGNYTLLFDNRHSPFASKAVDIIATVWRR